MRLLRSSTIFLLAALLAVFSTETLAATRVRIHASTVLVRTEVNYFRRHLVCLRAGGTLRPGYIGGARRAFWISFSDLLRKRFKSRIKRRSERAELIGFCNSASSASSSFAGSSSSTRSGEEFIIGVWYQKATLEKITTWKGRGINRFIGPPTTASSWNLHNFCSALNSQGLKAIVTASDYDDAHNRGLADYLAFRLRPDYPGYASPAGDPSQPGFDFWYLDPGEPELNTHMLWYPDGGPGHFSGPWGIYDPEATRDLYIARSNYLRSLSPTTKQIGLFTGSALKFLHGSPEHHSPYGIYESHLLAMMAPLDYLAMDYYPCSLGETDFNNFIGALTAMHEDSVLLGNKPWLCFIESANEHIRSAGRAPTPGEFRAEVWLAVIFGAKAIAYFPLSVGSPGSNDATSAEVVDEMIRQNAALQQWSGDLMNGGTLTKAPPFYKRSVASGRQFVINSSPSSGQYEGLSYDGYEIKVLGPP